MAAAVLVQADFISNAYDLPKEISRKVFKALRNFLRDPHHPGLHVEKLSGRASNLRSLRVDDNYRITAVRGNFRGERASNLELA
jgi:mRNA-degrading endonuclease RelE of RelBE toxin-antitoxin system